MRRLVGKLDYYKEVPIAKIVEEVTKDGTLNEPQGEDMPPPLFLAIEANRPALVDALLTNGASMDIYFNTNNPLSFAAREGNVEVVKVLISHGADVTAHPPELINHPLFYAAYSGNAELVKLLLQHGAPQYLPNTTRVPIRAAVGQEHLEVVKLLVENDPSVVHMQDEDNRTPLSYTNKFEIAKYLLENGASVASTPLDDPFEKACNQARFKLALLLHDYGAKIKMRIFGVCNLLCMNLKNSHLEEGCFQSNGFELLCKMMQQGEDVNYNKPLCGAIEYGHIRLMWFLLLHGADPDEKVICRPTDCWMLAEQKNKDFKRILCRSWNPKTDFQYFPQNVQKSVLRAVLCLRYLNVDKPSIMHILSFVIGSWHLK